MPTDTRSQDLLRILMVAPCPSMMLAAPTLAQHLQIPTQEAEERLSSVPSVLCERIAVPEAKRLANLLAAMGVQVRLEAASLPETPATAMVDVSLQPIEGDRLTELAQSVADWLPPVGVTSCDRSAKAIEAELAGPGGLILSSVSLADADLLRRVMRRIAGLRIAVSDPREALYDLLPDHRAPFSVPPAVTEVLRRMGLSPCKLTGAVASKLDRSTRDLLMARFSKAPLVAMNRDFQRFDLFLTGVQNVSPRELADFLVARSDLPRAMLERMPHPLRIECGLTRENALAFQSDYAALGFETCARLRVYYPVRCPLEDRVGP